MKMAKEKGLTGKSYVWIATQSVIGETREALPDFPTGMLGNYILHEFYILTSFLNVVWICLIEYSIPS